MRIQPYPGLRPFKSAEHDLFFGQESNLDDLFQRLGKKHFIAVLGESGCGKSSLVRAGLIPMLVPMDEGALVSWRVIIAQPGMNPISNLAQELRALGHDPATAVTDIERDLRVDPEGLIRVVERTKDSSRKFLLIVVDQFEELFRFRRESQESRRDDQAALYVKLLLNAAQREGADVYVVITMRSEYLGEASQFYNLAEAISDGLFLLPRMKRVQSEDAIVQPALSVGTELQQSIVQRLLNETEEREDGLPLLQHSLRRLWDKATESNGRRNVALPGEFSGNLEMDYVQWSLDDHLNEILRELSLARQQIAAKLFKLLGEWDLRGNLIRRPTKWVEVKGISPDEGGILAVVNAFRDEEKGRTFLVPSREMRPTFQDEDKLDISHEVLLRRWTTYRKWLNEELHDSARYDQLASAADRWAKGEGGFLQEPELSSLARWKDGFQPSAAWAKRYQGGQDESLQRNRREYQPAMEFLDASLKEYDRKEKDKQDEEAREKSRLVEAERAKSMQWVKGLAGIALVTVLVAGVWLWAQRRTNRELQDTVNLLRTAGVASEEGGVSMDIRVPFAIDAAQKANMIGSGLQQELLRQIRLDQWELFSALQKGTLFGPIGNLAPGSSKDALSTKVRSSCSISVISIGNDELAALADGQNLSIWRLGKMPEQVGVSFAFKGIECVKFRSDGKQLLVSSYSNQDGSTVTKLSFENGAVSRLPDIAKGTSSPIAVSFVGKSDEIAVLTSDSLTVYPRAGKPYSVPFKRPVQAGFFSPDRLYLLVSHTDGSAQIYNLDRDKVLVDRPLDFVGALKTTSDYDMIQYAAFSEDSSRIVTGSSQGWVGVLGNPWTPDKCAAKVAFTPVAKMIGGIGAVALQESAATDKGQNCEGELLAAGTVNDEAAVFKFQPANANRARTPETEPWLAAKTTGYSARRFIHQGIITSVTFAEGGEKLITASGDNKARVFEVGSGAEIARIPHNAFVIFAAKTNAGILSVSVDGQLQITNFDDKAERTVLRDWPKDACASEASGVSMQGTWVWSCADNLQSLDDKLTVQKDATKDATKDTTGVVSMGFSQDGSALVWLDRLGKSSENQKKTGREFSIHLADRQDPEWSRTSFPLELPGDTQSPIVAISSNGNFIGIAYGIETGKCEIRVFGVKPGMKLLKTLDGGTRRILSLAVSPQGAVAAGTSDSSLLRFKSQQENFVPEPEIIVESGPPGVGNVQNPHDRSITAVAYTGDGNLLVAKEDKWIGLYSISGTLLFPTAAEVSTAVASSDAPAQMFVFSQNGRVAAVGGSFATFFTIDGHGEHLERGLALHEPGTIQSLAFVDDDTAVTSVATGDSLVKITHNLNIDHHVRIPMKVIGVPGGW